MEDEKWLREKKKIWRLIGLNSPKNQKDKFQRLSRTKLTRYYNNRYNLNWSKLLTETVQTAN